MTRPEKTLIYVGPSMNPTLQVGDGLEVVPYAKQQAREGDVIVFHQPGANRHIVHRVVRVEAGGVRTRGDNSSQEDPWVVPMEQILGRVVRAIGRQGPQPVAAGSAGRFRTLALRAHKTAFMCVKTFLRPLYHLAVASGLPQRLLARWVRPRLVCFERATGTEFQLLLGGRVVGRLPVGARHWQIRPPYRLVVDERRLPVSLTQSSRTTGQRSRDELLPRDGLGAQVFETRARNAERFRD